MVWVWEPATNRLRSSITLRQVLLTPETRTLIGVGSAGASEDGPGPRYAIYDDVARTVLLRCVTER